MFFCGSTLRKRCEVNPISPSRLCTCGIYTVELNFITKESQHIVKMSEDELWLNIFKQKNMNLPKCDPTDMTGPAWLNLPFSQACFDISATTEGKITFTPLLLNMNKSLTVRVLQTPQAALPHWLFVFILTWACRWTFAMRLRANL